MVFISWHYCMSTSSMKYCRISAPRMDCCTSAIMKIHVNDRLSPRLRMSERFPYILMGVSFTVMRMSLFIAHLRLVGEGGMTLTSEPVSTRKCVWFHHLQKIGDRVEGWEYLSALGFPNCTGPCTYVLLHQTWRDTIRGVFRWGGAVAVEQDAQVTGSGRVVMVGPSSQRCN